MGGLIKLTIASSSQVVGIADVVAETFARSVVVVGVAIGIWSALYFDANVWKSRLK